MYSISQPIACDCYNHSKPSSRHPIATLSSSVMRHLLRLNRFCVGNLLHSHILSTILPLPQLVNIQRQGNALNLYPVSQYKHHQPSNQPMAQLTSIRQKLGTASSPSTDHPVEKAPVALPGLTKNLSIYSKHSNLCVPPQQSTSTSSLFASARSISGSLLTRVNPSRKPIRMLPCVTIWVSGREVASTSKRPLTIFRSGAIVRRYSYVRLSVRLPRQSVWPILPGARSFLNCKGG